MDVMLIVDMQVGLLNGEPKHDLLGVIDRINRLAARVREQVGIVIFIQHCGGEGDDFEPNAPGWAFLPELVRDPADLVVQKQLNDPFAGAELQARLNRIAPDRLLVTGWATDLCVDATVRSAVSNHHNVVVVTDAHTLSDRPHHGYPAERAGKRLYNSALFTGPSGHIGIYRKLHLWNNENRFFEPGDRGVPVFGTPLGRIVIAICYDGWFPETYRLAAMQGADIVCVPTNWVPMPSQPDDRSAMAATLTMAAAHSNGMAIACANRIGTERGQLFIGQSLIVGGDGWPLAGPASRESEEVLYATIDLTRTRAQRTLNEFNHVMRDRRADVYDPMLGTGWPASDV